MRRFLLVVVLVLVGLNLSLGRACAADFKHKIIWGDTLINITKKLCGKSEWKKYREIAKHNGIKNPDLIYVGRTLLVPRNLLVNKGEAKKTRSTHVSSSKARKTAKTAKFAAKAEIGNSSIEMNEAQPQVEKTLPVAQSSESKVESKVELLQPAKKPEQLEQKTVEPTKFERSILLSPSEAGIAYTHEDLFAKLKKVKEMNCEDVPHEYFFNGSQKVIIGGVNCEERRSLYLDLLLADNPEVSEEIIDDPSMGEVPK